MVTENCDSKLWIRGLASKEDVMSKSKGQRSVSSIRPRESATSSSAADAAERSLGWYYPRSFRVRWVFDRLMDMWYPNGVDGAVVRR
jgi:hypothetical protein